MRRVLSTVAVLSALTGVDAAQQPTPVSSELRFEVTSVKRSPPILDRALQPFVGVPQPGVWRLRDQPIVSALRNAYPGHPLPAQVVGAPEWVNRDYYDIEARTSPTATAGDVRQMVRMLLAERFKLALRQEKRQVTAFALVTRKDGRLGRGLQPPTVDCAAFRAGGPRPDDPARKAYADRLPCAVTVMPTFDHTLLIPGANMRLTAGDVPIASILTLLGNYLNRPVIDGTGLSERFDIELQFFTGAPRIDGDDGPPLRAAIGDQLGLQVQDVLTVSDVLVIDRIERPTEN
jgi:uncharacterized protein (TIGR03435 family)